MKTNTLLALTLGGLIVSGTTVAQGDSITCCLADVWQLEKTVTDHQQGGKNCPPKSASAAADDITCCLAEEWILSAEPSIADLSGPGPAARLTADDFCCIAEEWRIR